MRSARRASIPVSCLLFAATVALGGATHCGGDAKSDVGATAGTGQLGEAGSAGSRMNSGGGSGAGSAGAVSVGTGGTGGSSGSGSAGASSSCGGSRSTPVGRPTAPACAPTPVGTPSARACTVDGDCADAGISARCLNGKCGADECLTDSDCASGQACSCANQQGGNADHSNVCIPTGCRVDADCGANGACSPDNSGFCSSFTGYHCHTAADTCNSDADCCGSTSRCGYQQELGHWACAAIVVCSG